MLLYRFIVAGSLVFSGQDLLGQEFCVQALGTYQLPIGGLTASEVDSPLPPDGSPRVTNYERVNLNWGHGGGVGLTAGMIFSKHVGVELRSTWFPGTRTTWHSEAGFGVEDFSIEMSFFRVEPIMRLSIGDSTSSWYMAIGPSMALFPRSKWSAKQELNYPTLSTNVAVASDTYGGIGLGALAAAGFTYHTKGGFGVFGEINCTAQTWSPDREDLTEYVFFDEDKLSTLSTSELITTYVDEYSTNENEDPSKPYKSLRFHYPMSSWGFRIGVQYSFGRRGAR